MLIQTKKVHSFSEACFYIFTGCNLIGIRNYTIDNEHSLPEFIIEGRHMDKKQLTYIDNQNKIDHMVYKRCMQIIRTYTTLHNDASSFMMNIGEVYHD